MSPDRIRRIRDYDAAASEYLRDCSSAGWPRRIARDDVEILFGLARLLTLGIRGWSPLVGRLELARVAPLVEDRAIALVLETVFDEILAPAAWRVLAAAVEVARDAPVEDYAA